MYRDIYDIQRAEKNNQEVRIQAIEIVSEALYRCIIITRSGLHA